MKAKKKYFFTLSPPCAVTLYSGSATEVASKYFLFPLAGWRTMLLHLQRCEETANCFPPLSCQLTLRILHSSHSPEFCSSIFFLQVLIRPNQHQLWRFWYLTLPEEKNNTSGRPDGDSTFIGGLILWAFPVWLPRWSSSRNIFMKQNLRHSSWM